MTTGVYNRGRNVVTVIQNSVASKTSAAAILTPGRQNLTYGTLFDQVDHLARKLIDSGVQPGARIGIAIPSGPEATLWMLAAMKIGVAAPVNPYQKEQERNLSITDLRLGCIVDSDRIRVIDPENTSETEGVALVLQTSGTTLRSRIVPMTHDHLIANLQSVCQFLKLTESDKCINVMPMFHLHGIVFGVLASLWSGGSVVCPSSYSAEEFSSWMEQYLPTWYSASPTIHLSILEQQKLHASGARKGLRFIRSSSSALPFRWMHDLEDIMETPVVQGYGMTECVQITCNPLPPGKRRPGSVGVNAGPELAIRNENGIGLFTGENGEILIRGPLVMSGYEGINANEDSWVDGWFRTGDLGFVDHEGHLFLTGRLKEMINKGGQKISPLEVEEVLCNHPAVAQSASFPIPHPRYGEDIGTAIVLREGCTATEQEIRAFLNSRLSYYKVPGLITFLDRLPQTATGKLHRLKIVDQLGLSETNTSELQQQVKTAWCDILKVSNVAPQDNFFLLGGDSILATYMISRIRRLRGVNFPLRLIFDAPTFLEFCNLLLEYKEDLSVDMLEQTVPSKSVTNGSGFPQSMNARELKFSLFFFSADESHDLPRYRLLLEAAKFADDAGFHAIWTPERHFHAFGGLYPNPSILAAALAMVTKRIQIRAGSVVLPLHDPIRIAEEWSVVDNLSSGRIGISAASGWHVNDFALSPKNYENRKDEMFERLDILKSLWQGKTIRRMNGAGQEMEVRIFPQPVQPELPVWLSCHSDSTFTKAAELNCNVITTIYNTNIEDLQRQIALYRKTLANAGHNPGQKTVTLMLHTYVENDQTRVSEGARIAFQSYLSTFLNLHENQAEGLGAEFHLNASDQETIASRALPRFLNERGLIGRPEFCYERARFFHSIGVNEIACLIDFGIPTDAVLESLHNVKDLKDRFAETV